MKENKHRLTFIHTCEFDGSELVYKSNSVMLHEILGDLKLFLAGCGYSINGELEVVEQEKEDV